MPRHWRNSKTPNQPLDRTSGWSGLTFAREEVPRVLVAITCAALLDALLSRAIVVMPYGWILIPLFIFVPARRPADEGSESKRSRALVVRLSRFRTYCRLDFLGHDRDIGEQANAGYLRVAAHNPDLRRWQLDIIICVLYSVDIHKEDSRCKQQ